MIRRSPCEFYLKYLILHPKKYSNEKIVDLCEKKQLDVLGEWYLDQLRGDLSPPDPFYPTDQLHSKSQRFLLKEKVQRLFCPDADMKQALKLLDHPRGKEFTEAMLLSGAPVQLIAGALGPHKNFECTEKTVSYYKHFFWNIDLVDSTELRTLLQLRAPNKDDVPDKQKKTAAVMHKMYKEDPRVVAAHLPNSPLVALMSQMRMGLMPRDLDLGNIVEVTRKMAALRALEAVSKDDTFASKRALEYTMVARNMTEMMEMIIRPDEKLRQELSTIALKTEIGPVPYIHSLSEGEHTVEMSPRMGNDESDGDESASDEASGSSTT